MLKYIDGDFSPGTTAELFGEDLYLIENKVLIHLNRDIVESVEKLTEETKHKWLAKAGWGVAGSLLLGPVGAAAGLFWGGKSKLFTVVCSLSDGRSFMAEINDTTYKKLVASSVFSSRPTTATAPKPSSSSTNIVPPGNYPRCNAKETKTVEAWKQDLSPEVFHILREHGTERAGSSPLHKQYAQGRYDCGGCGQALFTSDTKFDSGTGWPSFYTPIKNAVEATVDRSFFMTRTEIHCSKCGGHLGHVFDDGPAPTGKRYCMNGAAMKFVPEGEA